MFARSFVGACVAGAALSLNLVDQTPTAIDELLSQTAAAKISASICQRTVTMNKAAVPDFYGIYGGTSLFTDSAFPANWTTMAWADAGEKFTEFTNA